MAESTHDENHFQNLLDASPNAMLLVDSRGCITYGSSLAFAYFGYSRDELIGMNVDRLVPQTLRAGHAQLRSDYFREPRLRAMAPERELYAQRRDGSTFPVDIGLSPVRIGEERFVLAAINDITVLKRMRDYESRLAATTRELLQKTSELARSNAELEQFAYVASHDLQEPLRMVASYLQLIQQRYLGRLDSDADEFIEFAVDGAKRMKQLINDLLEYSRAGRAQAPARVELAPLVARVLATLDLRIQECGAKIEVAELPTVIGDESGLYHVLLNLVSNALKFRGKDAPRIRIGAERTGEQWMLSVADNGIGVPVECHEQIFLMFQRLHQRSEYEGTGIGLAICKRIVERHGGRIWIESTPDHGSTFHLTLPADTDSAGADGSIR